MNKMIAGVDGCHSGWLCIMQDEGTIRAEVFPSFQELLKEVAAASVIAVDIPIGLPETGSRSCDIAARKLLGKPRSCSVFAAPVRGVINETDHATASALHREIDTRGLTVQAFHILHKIREVDAILLRDPLLQEKIREVHPEVCFARMNGGPAMKASKKRTAGKAEREKLIDTEWPSARHNATAMLQGISGWSRDDLNDAFAALWTAKRIAESGAECLGNGEVDSAGIRMEIWV